MSTAPEIITIWDVILPVLSFVLFYGIFLVAATERHYCMGRVDANVGGAVLALIFSVGLVLVLCGEHQWHYLSGTVAMTALSVTAILVCLDGRWTTARSRR